VVVSYFSLHTAELHGDEELSSMLQGGLSSLHSVPELTVMLKQQVSVPELHPASTLIIIPIMSPLVIAGGMK